MLRRAQRDRHAVNVVVDDIDCSTNPKDFPRVSDLKFRRTAPNAVRISGLQAKESASHYLQAIWSGHKPYGVLGGAILIAFNGQRRKETSADPASNGPR